jgi:hypothetical protein
LEAFDTIHCLLAIACQTDDFHIFGYAQQQPKSHSHLWMIIGERDTYHGIPELFSAA